MKVWVYKNLSGSVFFESKNHGIVYLGSNLIGTLDLPIEPEKKEVVKDIAILNCGYAASKPVQEFLPDDAYDVKLTYKVKE